MSTSPEPISRATALRVISMLRNGASSLDSAPLFSAGRVSLYRAAETLFEETELTDGAAVRWIKGGYGAGKTHSFARLTGIACNRKWAFSYVQIGGRNDQVELHRFDSVLTSILRNLESAPASEGSAGRDGWGKVLDDWVLALRSQAGAREGGDLQSMRFDSALAATRALLQRDWGLHGAFVAALCQYAVAQRDGDLEWAHLIRDWFAGEDIAKRDAEIRKRTRKAGILEPVSRRNAKGILRQISAFLRYRGFKGTLILVDEVENVLLQPPKARRTAYTILRELIDNVDDRHGMRSTLFYLSGTPDLFDGEQGILEYEALASRALPPSVEGAGNPAGLVIDLSRFPMTSNDLVAIGLRIAALYAIAKGLDGHRYADKGVHELLKGLEGKAGLPSPRVWVKAVVEFLDKSVDSGAEGVTD